VFLDADVYRHHGFAACLVNPITRMSVSGDEEAFLGFYLFRAR
jgi:hypothetical protein